MASIFAREALTRAGWQANVLVEIDQLGRIADVNADASPAADSHRVAALLPAPSNLHSHTFQRAMAGLAEARGPAAHDSFWTWREIMYRFLDVLEPDEIEAVAALAFMEMQEAGFAAVAEFHYLHHQPGGAAYADPGELGARIAAAAAETGIGLTLLPVHYAQGGVDGRPLAGGQLRFGNDLDRYLELVARAEATIKALPGDAGWGYAPHSLRAVGAADLERLAGMRGDRPFHMHIAEQKQEIDEMLAVHGARPVEWLLDTVAVDRHWCLIHCTHMSEKETAGLAAAQATAGLCPVTEGNLGDGIFDGAHFRAAGGVFGVGSDSNIRIGVAGELRQLEYSQRLRDRLRVVMADAGQSSGRELYGTAMEGGARALGRDSGALAPGQWADLLALDPARSALFGLAGDRLLDGWIFAGGNEPVTDLWSAGRHMVRDGRHRGRDAIVRRYSNCMESVMARL
ncbi:MAG: formimidoylglutamate deiminase [Nitratireductor sp.]